MTKRLKAVDIPKTGRLTDGEVVSVKMDKTVVVKVYRAFKHPLIGKTIRRFKKYKVHDEESQAGLGDIVEISECRPISKTKHMILSKIVRRAA